MDLYSIFEAAEATGIGTFVRESNWIFPMIQCIHLLSIALLGGAVLTVDLSLIGVALRPQQPSLVERSARPWLNLSVTVVVITGVLMGFAEALKLYDRQAFFVKMLVLGIAILFTYALRNPLAHRLEPATVPARLVATVSIGLWLVVAIAGRWIGFS